MPKPIPETAAGAFDITGKPFQEGYELWKSGCEIWLAYLAELPTVRTPAALMDINTRFMARCMNVTGFAEGGLLKDAGLRAPTLNEA
jgi:hypothetical protein